MNNSTIYKRFRFPSVIIQYSVWLYYRFKSSLAPREASASPKAPTFGGYGEVVDVFLQKRRDGAAAKRFFKILLKKHQAEPRKIVTDKLRSYGVAHRELIPDTIHDTSQYANNRAELSHQPTRVRERCMRRFKSIVQAQRFLGVHSAVYN